MPQIYDQPKKPKKQVLDLPKNLPDTAPPDLGRPAAVAAPVAVAAYDAPLPSQPAATLEPQATAKYDYQSTHVKAQWLEVSSGRTNEMFQFIDPGAIKQIPFTLAHTTVANQDEGLTYAVNDAVTWMSTVYGNEALGALVLSNLITDPTSRARTQAVLGDIAGQNFVGPNYMAGGYSVVDPQSEQAQQAFAEIMKATDPVKALQGLPPDVRLATQTLAQQFNDSIQSSAQAGNPIADQFGRVVAVAQGGYSVALDQREQDILSQFVKGAQTGVGGTTQGNLGAAAASIGIDQIRRLGQGQIVLDSEWARANPDEALAEKLFLEAQYPGAQIVLGKQGIIGSVLDKFGMAIDYTTAVGGAALHQVSSELNKFGSGDRTANLNAITRAEQQINAGEPPPDWVVSIMKGFGKDPSDPQQVAVFLAQQKSMNTLDVSPTAFWQDLKDNTRPEMLGFGLADNVMKSASILPGDPEYSFAHTAVGIITQFAFDPAFWGPSVIGGLRDAGVLARIVGDVGGIPKIVDATGIEHVLQVSNSAIHNAVYYKFARTADEAVQTRSFINKAADLAEVAKVMPSEGSLATLLQDVAGIDMEEARRMANIIYPRPGATVEEARASAGIGMLDDALGTGAVDTVDRAYGIQTKLDEVNAALPLKMESADFFNDEALQIAVEDPAGRYLFHATPRDNLESIAQGGLNLSATPSTGERGLFVGTDWSSADRLSPHQPNKALLRIDTEALPRDVLQRVETGDYPGEGILQDAVPSSAVEYLAADQVWRPVQDMPSAVDSLAQKHTLESVLAGHDPIHDATRGFIGGKQIRRLRSAAGLPTSAFDRAVDAVGQSIAKFPANILIRNSEDLARVAEANPEAAPSIQVAFAEMDHLWRKPGFRTKFVFKDTTEFSKVSGVEAARQALSKAQEIGDTEKVAIAQSQLDSALTELVGSPDASLREFHNAARSLGIPDNRYRQLIEPYVSGVIDGDRAAQYDWFKATYSSLIHESPVLDGLGKKGLSDLYSTWLEDRNAARLTETGYGGSVHTEPVLVRQIPGITPYGIPTIDADLVRSVDLPDLSAFRSYATMTGRTMKAWAEAGDVRKAISLTHGALARSWRTATSWWRSWILGSRIFGALPLRIIGEQQLRMAAFDYSSLVWHPSEWFASTNWGERYFKDAQAMWYAAGRPEHALGTMVDDMRYRVPMLSKATASLGGGVAGEDAAFFRSYSQMLTKYSASSSVNRWRLVDGQIRSPEEVLAAIQAETSAPLRQTWLRQFELTRAPGDVRPTQALIDEALGRWDQEMKQLVGRDPENLIKRAISERKLNIDGVDYEIGTSQFADKLQSLYAEGRWRPGMKQLPTKLGEYLPGDKTSLMKGFTQKLFKMFYSNPDLATSRVPLYRQIFQRQYDNLIKLGYREDRAVEVARSMAAEHTADLLFQLGAHTNGEYLLREIMPFFPAYRELATTWIGRIPARIGQLSESHAAAVGWVVGATALSERANLVLKSATELGLVHQDPQGNYFVNIPLFGNILEWMTFGKVNATDINAHVPLESLVGILPVPFGLANTDDQGRPLPLQERLRGMLPTLGGPVIPVLAGLKAKFPEFFGPVEDWLTMFGSDQSLGIPLIDQIWEGVTHEATPFALGRAGVLRDAQVNFALIDGMRLAIHENPPPAFPGEHMTTEQSAVYEKQWLAWRNSILKSGAAYQQHLYLLKAAIGAVLPFSVQFSDQYKTEVAAMWQILNHVPGGSTGAVGRAEMNLFLGRNPGLEPFLAGKTMDTRLYDHPNESIQDFFKAIGNGDVKVRNANDWVTYAVATNSYSEHMARVAEIRANAGSTWQEVLMNFDAKQQLSQEQDRWQAFLDWNHNHMAALGIPDVRSMLDTVSQYKAIRAGKVPQLTLDQERLISFDQTMRHYAKYFDYNPENAGAYNKIRSAAYDALFKSLGQPSDISASIGNWFKNTADPYYKKLDALYGKLDTAKPNQTETIYSDIRKLSDHYDALARKSGDPTPEAYVFAKKTPQEQQQTVAKWASLPGVYLTAFQRRQVNYSGDDTALTKYANYSAWLNTQMRSYATKAGITVNTTAWDDLTARRDQFLARKAQVLKVTDTVKEYNAPTYVRVGKALDLNNTPGWSDVTTLVHQADQWLASVRGGTGVSPAGSTVEAERTRAQFAKIVEGYRATDPQLDAALTEIGVAVQKTNHYDLYDYLFFDKFF